MTTKTIANGDRHSTIEYGPLSLRGGHSTIEYGPQSLSLTSRRKVNDRKTRRQEDKKTE